MGLLQYKCTRCAAVICFREEVLNMAMGVMESKCYLCFRCIAGQFERTQEEMFQYLDKYLQRRPCFLKLWDETTPCSTCTEMEYCFCPAPQTLQ